MAQYYSYTSQFIFGAIFLLFRSSCSLCRGVIVLWVHPKMPISASGRVVMAIVGPISHPYCIQNGSVLYMYFPIYVWVMFSTFWIMLLIVLGCHSTLGAPQNANLGLRAGGYGHCVTNKSSIFDSKWLSIIHILPNLCLGHVFYILDHVIDCLGVS